VGDFGQAEFLQQRRQAAGDTLAAEAGDTLAGGQKRATGEPAGWLGDGVAGQAEITATMVRPILILSPFLRRWAW
jgi:hypothetical protein